MVKEAGGAPWGSRITDHYQSYHSDDDFLKKEEDEDKKIVWVGEGVRRKKRVYYPGVKVEGSLELFLGDTVLACETDINSNSKLRAATVVQVYQGVRGAMVHLQWFLDSRDGPLDDLAHPEELLMTDKCRDLLLRNVWERCKVERRPVPAQDGWKMSEDANFWVAHWYDEGSRFEEPPRRPACPEGEELAFCGVCAAVKEKEASRQPVVEKEAHGGGSSIIRWQGRTIKPDDGVYLKAGTVKFKVKQELKREFRTEEPKTVDEDVYTEHYRKKDQNEKLKSPEPFQIGLVRKIRKKGKSVKLQVKLFYRPGKLYLFILYI